MGVIRQAVAKKLSRVEIDSEGSNQHELNGTVALKRFFGFEKVNLDGALYYVGSNGHITSVPLSLTWYDAREASADRTGRSEYRLYYSGDVEEIMEMASPGDMLVITEDAAGHVQLIIVAKGVEFIQVLAQVLDGRLSDQDYHRVTDLTQMETLANMLELGQ